MARHNHQQGIAAVGLPSPQQQFRFVLVAVKAGAAAYRRRPAAYFAFELGGFLQLFGRRGNVVFGVAAHFRVGRAQAFQTACIGFGLDIAAFQGGQGRADKGSGLEVAALRFFRQAGIGEK